MLPRDAKEYGLMQPPLQKTFNYVALFLFLVGTVLPFLVGPFLVYCMLSVVKVGSVFPISWLLVLR